MDKEKRGLVTTIIIVLLALPAVLSGMMTFPVFSNAFGSADGWLSYWGGYLGAVIGASVVYFVSRMQIKEQNKMQLDAIDKENKITLNREMEQYYFRLEVEKLEELFHEIDIFNNVSTNSYNDFIRYITITHVLYEDQLIHSEEEINKFNLEVKELRVGWRKLVEEGYSSLYILNRLSLYIDDSKPYINDIIKQYDIYVNEIKGAYRDDFAFITYISKENAGDNINLVESIVEISDLINVLSSKILQPNLQSKIKIMRNSKTL